jgi:hypothetical protein
MKAIPKTTLKQIEDLAAKLDDRADNIRTALDALNAEASKYNDAVEDLRGVYRELAETAQAYFDDRSDNWQNGEAGSAYAVWINELRLVDHTPLDLEEIKEPEQLFDGDSFEWPANQPD